MEILGGAIGKKTLAALDRLKASGGLLRASGKEMDASEIKTRIEFFWQVEEESAPFLQGNLDCL